MGLFKNNKRPRLICGEGTPRLLATQIADNTPLCFYCAGTGKQFLEVETALRD